MVINDKPFLLRSAGGRRWNQDETCIDESEENHGTDLSAGQYLLGINGFLICYTYLNKK